MAESIPAFFAMAWQFMPLLVLYLLGILLAFFYRSRMRSAWKFLAAGCALLLLGTVVGVSHSAWLYFAAFPNQYDADSIGIANLAFGTVNLALTVIGFILVLASAITGRSGSAKLPGQIDEN